MIKKITTLIAFAICTFNYNSNAQVADDVGIESVLNPTNGSTLTLNNSYSVTVVIKNFGSTIVTQIPVQFAVGTNTPLNGTCTAFINAGDTAHYTFQNQLTVSSDFSGVGYAYTNLAGDGNSNNNQVDLNYNFGTSDIHELENSFDFIIQNTTDQNTIKLTLDKNNDTYILEIFDLTGKLFKKEKLTRGCTMKEINVSELNKGTYIAKLQTSKGVSAKTFIK